MPLTPGIRLGSYEITGSIGAGGMGEVYRARDTKLNRDVAIKVLPELFASDPDRLARFEREAQALAALNHPNIAQVFGVLEEPAALAMEFVDGEDLSDRIARGPVPLEEALPIGKQIAEALEAAHERGIVHRDLKPANVKVRHDGTVKVLDFGLAKAMETIDGSGIANPSASPTFTSPAHQRAHGTALGMIVGTAAYMSPEQARGKPLDKRADIWAFGVVLFEMLSGRQQFAGETVSDTLAAVLREDIDWSQLPAATPPAVVRMLQRCLQKDPRKRLRDIGDARIDIEDAIAGGGPQIVTASPAAAPPRRAALAMAAVALAALALGASATWLFMRARVATAPPSRVTFDIAPSASTTGVPDLALSPDGRFVVYSSPTDAGGEPLSVHRFDEGISRVLPGTTGAEAPFVSPDGRWVGFFRSSRLHKISIEGGDALPICPAGAVTGALWLPDGHIVFSSWLTGLSRVSADGGAPQPLTRLDAAAGEIGHWWPSQLPDGRVLFTVFKKGAGLNDNHLAVLDPQTGKHQVLFAGAHGKWMPPGDLLFFRSGRYQLVPFDLRSLRATGEAAHVFEDAVGLDPAGDNQQPFSISATGNVAYVPGRYMDLMHVVEVSPSTGELRRLPLPERSYAEVAVAPDRERVALTSLEGGRFVLRVAELKTGTESLLDLEGMNWTPVWHPNGRDLAFRSMRKGDFDIFIKDLSSSARERPLLDGPADESPAVWTSDGRLVFEGSNADGSYTHKLMDLADRAKTTVLTPGYSELAASISPDNRWLAYIGNSEGRFQVFVQPIGGGPAVRVTQSGGSAPQFRPGSDEFYYRRGSQLMQARWRDVGGRFTVLSDRVVATAAWSPRVWASPYAVTADGRIYALVSAQPPAPARIRILLNWRSKP